MRETSPLMRLRTRAFFKGVFGEVPFSFVKKKSAENMLGRKEQRLWELILKKFLEKTYLMMRL